ncbi:GTPase IMAP family member 9-like [Fundulus diaphanus]
MRIYETVLYKQEVMHVVLVHSPANQNFSHCPLLTDDPDAICVYKDGRFIWRPEAMCETHWCEMICRHDSKQLEACGVAENLHYVWDHVAVALHVGKTQVLRFDTDRLRNNLKYCCQDDVSYTPKDLKEVEFSDAKPVVRRLWPDWMGPLQRTSSLLHRLTVSDVQLVLVGWPGVGKSSSGNTILGRTAFRTSNGPNSGGTRCCLQRATIFSREVTIIDAPGLSAPLDPEVRKEIFRCINLSAPAAHAVLLVLRLDFTTRAEETVKLMEEMFGRKVWSRTLILFTHQDRAEPHIQNQLQSNGAQMKTLLFKVGNRFQVLNNKLDHRDVQQVWDLLFQVKEMLVNNHW